MEQRPDNRKKVLLATAVAAIIAGLAAYSVFTFMGTRSSAPSATEKIPVRTLVVQTRALDRTIVLTADIRPMAEVDVFPKIPGKIIEQILVDRGDTVRQKELVAVLEERAVNAQVKEARAAYDLAVTNREVLDKDYARLANLYEEKAVARQRLDHIMAQKDSASAQVERAKAVLEQLEILRADHRIYAPITGLVSARYLDPGALSAPGSPVIRITDEGRLKIIAGVTEKDFHLIERGMKCKITTDAIPQRVFTGFVTVMNPTLNPSTRTGEFEVHLDNKDMLLRSGMFAHLTLYLGTVSGLAVSREALQKIPGTGDYFVYVVKNGKAELRNVETGLAAGNTVQVTTGLEENEEVVVLGQNRLKDGTEVIVESRQKGVEGPQ